jgi:hypothetical protein
MGKIENAGSSRPRVETDPPECTRLEVRTIPEDRLPVLPAPAHRITPTRRRQSGFVLCGWDCECGQCERPRYADPDQAAGAAARHLAEAS